MFLWIVGAIMSVCILVDSFYKQLDLLPPIITLTIFSLAVYGVWSVQ